LRGNALVTEGEMWCDGPEFPKGTELEKHIVLDALIKGKAK
jgi:hypothetical protein